MFSQEELIDKFKARGICLLGLLQIYESELSEFLRTISVRDGDSPMPPEVLDKIYADLLLDWRVVSDTTADLTSTWRALYACLQTDIPQADA